MKVEKLIERLEKISGQKIKLIEGLSHNDEQIIIQLGQQIDDQVYSAYLKYRGDWDALSKAVRAVGKLMKDPDADELYIEASPEFETLCKILYK